MTILEFQIKDHLLSYAIKKPREYILIHPEYKLSLWQKARFWYANFQYKRGVPLAYITGHKEFFGLDFFVNRHTLIPRPETELMVEAVIRNLESGIWNKATIIDVGTGTGCIPISIVKTLKHENIRTFAIDISGSALKVAKKNAELHGVDIDFLHGNLLEPILNDLSPALSSVEAERDVEPSPPQRRGQGEVYITANLPYLTAEQYKDEPSIQHEPKSALIANENGLALYRELLEQIKQLGHPFTAFFEFDPRQTEALTKLIKSFFPAANLEIKKDLAGRERLAIVKNPES
ncbi:MAG: peptide chain release factor N(5)-glutamine methyltransferase [Patescibacteria group bacterium]